LPRYCVMSASEYCIGIVRRKNRLGLE